MERHEQARGIISREPGIGSRELAERFRVSSYRLNRILRRLERSLRGQVLVRDKDDRGVWIVDVDDSLCLDVVWLTEGKGIYRQCPETPEFPDGRCADHSRWEDPEMVAFERELSYLAGPGKPTAFNLGHLGITRLTELESRLQAVEPKTSRDGKTKETLTTAIRAALGFLRWKQRFGRDRADGGIPFEFFRRHRESSGNSFEFGIGKEYAVLEVPADAPRDAVLSAWKRLAKRYHPDGGSGDEEKMKALNLAKDKIFRIRRWD
jgi:hypothetical protein